MVHIALFSCNNLQRKKTNVQILFQKTNKLEETNIDQSSLATTNLLKEFSKNSREESQDIQTLRNFRVPWISRTRPHESRFNSIAASFECCSKNSPWHASQFTEKRIVRLYQQMLPAQNFAYR